MYALTNNGSVEAPVGSFVLTSPSMAMLGALGLLLVSRPPWSVSRKNIVVHSLPPSWHVKEVSLALVPNIAPSAHPQCVPHEVKHQAEKVCRFFSEAKKGLDERREIYSTCKSALLGAGTCLVPISVIA